MVTNVLGRKSILNRKRAAEASADLFQPGLRDWASRRFVEKSSLLSSSSSLRRLFVLLSVTSAIGFGEANVHAVFVALNHKDEIWQDTDGRLPLTTTGHQDEDDLVHMSADQHMFGLEPRRSKEPLLFASCLRVEAL